MPRPARRSNRLICDGRRPRATPYGRHLSPAKQKVEAEPLNSVPTLTLRFPVNGIDERGVQNKIR
jgi:hypothetical protein